MTEEELLDTIRAFYTDTSRTKEETVEGLQNALEDIQMYIEALEN